MPKPRQTSGFTLIEMVIVIVLLGIIASFAGKLLLQSARSAHTQYNTAETLEPARLALFRIAKDIRNIRSNTATDLNISSANQLILTTSSGKKITYSLSGTQLLLNRNALANHVSSLSFNYYNSAGSSTTTVTDVHYIRVQLTVAQNNNATRLQTTAYLRNVS